MKDEAVGMNRKTKLVLIELTIASVVVGVLAWITIPRFLAAQNINTPQRFPDPNFRAVVERFMDVQPGGRFTGCQAAAKSGVLRCPNRNIKEMKGIEHFRGITGLNCEKNQLTEKAV